MSSKTPSYLENQLSDVKALLRQVRQQFAELQSENDLLKDRILKLEGILHDLQNK